MAKRILFIVSGYYLNGGSTFLCRLTKSLSNKGISTGILFLQDKGDTTLLETLNKFNDIKFLNCSRSFLNKIYYLTIFKKQPEKLFDWINGFQHVHVMGLFPLMFILSIGNFRIPYSIGVYQQNEYFGPNKGKYLFQRIVEKKLKEVDPTSWVFFNEANRKMFRERLAIKKIDNSQVMPIGIEEKKERNYEANENLIISVGNLMPFKTYFKAVINVLADLKKMEMDAKYEIYGSGPMKRELIE
ncbi:MAG: hypothetical protein MJA83_02570, partial [Gammaproteobacteria bacterium]|nr:hypothetical protein [Gammaproteobacteria bacterium]